jgi:Kazal-type serine protease inhibitor domain
MSARGGAARLGEEPMVHKLPIIAVAGMLVLFWTVNGASAAKLGERCDGFAGGRCSRDLRCDPGPGQCGLADPHGTCVKVRQLCFQLYRPVCGCNGRTYPNDCHRIRSRVAKKHDGKC